MESDGTEGDVTASPAVFVRPMSTSCNPFKTNRSPKTYAEEEIAYLLEQAKSDAAFCRLNQWLEKPRHRRGNMVGETTYASILQDLLKRSAPASNGGLGDENRRYISLNADEDSRLVRFMQMVKEKVGEDTYEQAVERSKAETDFLAPFLDGLHAAKSDKPKYSGWLLLSRDSLEQVMKGRRQGNWHKVIKRYRLEVESRYRISGTEWSDATIFDVTDAERKGGSYSPNGI